MYSNNDEIKSRKKLISDFLIFNSLLLYRIILDILYIKYVVPNYEYYHFTLDYNFNFMCLSYFFVIIMSFFALKLLDRKRMSDLIVTLLIIIYFIPYTSIMALCTHEIKYCIFVFIYFLLLVFFNKFINFNKFKIISGKRFIHPKLFYSLTIICALIIIVVSGYYTGFRISLSLSEYYEYRAAAREYSVPLIMKYLINWSIVGLDIGLAYCIINKKKFLILPVIVANLFAFSYNGKKSVLFILVITIIISMFYKNKYAKKIPFAFLGLSLGALLELTLRNGKSFIAKNFIRRMLFIPPLLGTIYYDYFSTHELDYLRSSILRRIGFESPYTSIPRFIGQIYYNNVGIIEMNANTGLCGSAFSNFGFLSLLIAPIIIIITFKIIESCAKNVNEKIKVVTAIWLAYTFVSGTYFTLLLTDGVMFLGFLLHALSLEKNINTIGGTNSNEE